MNTMPMQASSSGPDRCALNSNDQLSTFFNVLSNYNYSFNNADSNEKYEIRWPGNKQKWLTKYEVEKFLPPWLLDACVSSDDSRCLAEMFEKLENDEKERLQKLIAYHSKFLGNQGVEKNNDIFRILNLCGGHPYSISAGIEKGEKNRYSNIWPYDHARVKLSCRMPRNPLTWDPQNNIVKTPDSCLGPSSPQVSPTGEEGYINASFLEMPGVARRYIATQGPLPCTLHDFWQLVWQQNVQVIVMLTREKEAGKSKCMRYWPRHVDETLQLVDSPLSVRYHDRVEWSRNFSPSDIDDPEDLGRLVYEEEHVPLSPRAQEKGPFGGSTSDTPAEYTSQKDLIDTVLACDDYGASTTRDVPIVTRKLVLKHQRGEERVVHHVQYYGLPDFGVPDAPCDLLQVRKIANDIQQQYERDVKAQGRCPTRVPLLVHCR